MRGRVTTGDSLRGRVTTGDSLRGRATTGDSLRGRATTGDSLRGGATAGDSLRGWPRIGIHRELLPRPVCQRVLKTKMIMVPLRLFVLRTGFQVSNVSVIPKDTKDTVFYDFKSHQVSLR